MMGLPSYLRNKTFARIVPLLAICLSSVVLSGCTSIDTDAVPTPIARKISLEIQVSEQGNPVALAQSNIMGSRKSVVSDQVLLELCILTAAEDAQEKGHEYMLVFKMGRKPTIRRSTGPAGGWGVSAKKTFYVEYGYGSDSGDYSGKTTRVKVSETIAELRKSLGNRKTFTLETPF